MSNLPVFSNISDNSHASELETLKKYKDEIGAECVIFHGRYPLNDMPSFYDSSDAMVATFQDNSILGYTLPRKITSYMAAGRPILGTVVGEARHIIEEAGCGLCCDAEDPVGLAEICLRFADMTPEQREALRECNSGVYAFDARELNAHIGQITNNNVQGEYYLTDMIQIMREAGLAVSSVHCDDYAELLGVNSRIQLAQATKIMQRRINEAHMAAGVTMIDPDQVWIGPDVTIGQDTVIWPGCYLLGATTVGTECTIGPDSRLTNATVGNNVLADETIIVDSTVDDDVHCGPRAYLRGGAHFCRGSKAGTHVEIKGSTVGEGSKVPHLSYIGDATLGKGVNIGGGSITCNYDGKHKSHTEIGDNVFVGSDTMMVAPVTIGDGALVGASSCITQDVPAGALALERSRQFVKEGWATEYFKKLKEED